MGDRGNIIIEFGKETVGLYTHWEGVYLPRTLRSALKRGESKLTNGPQLARIIFCEMVKHSVSDTSGFGISNCIQDCNANQNIILNVDNQTVSLKGDNPIPISDFLVSGMKWDDDEDDEDDVDDEEYEE